MKNVLVRLMFMAVIPMTAVCCIKEDRDSCPCLLVLDFSEVDTSDVKTVELLMTDNVGLVMKKSLEVSEYYPEYRIPVPRTDMAVNVYSGAESGCISVEGLRIPYGEQAPELYMDAFGIEGRNETWKEQVRLNKNHCMMTIEFTSSLNKDAGIRVCGNVDGCRTDGTPSEGRFSYVPECIGGVFRACVPRQRDSSLMLEIDDGTDVLKKFALGEHMASGGYDWNSEDLEDVMVKIDWTYTAVSLVIEGWDWVYETEIII